MSRYITIDGGTTNTRIFLASDGNVTDEIKIGLGAREGRENRALLQSGIRDAIQTLLERNSLSEGDITCIVASGMITSELGLCPLAHLEAPVGIDELHEGMYRTHLPEISSIPFAFIRGVKIASACPSDIDVMRGEETELIGIMRSEERDCAYLLPGSHSKLIRTDADGRICAFSTMLTGEMLFALSEQTILKNAVDLHISQTDRAYLLQGYDACRQIGINRALFKVRLLQTMLHCDPVQIYSYFLGVVLCGEIEQILACDASALIIGGKAQIKTAMAEILQSRGNKRILVLDEQEVAHSVARGAIRIFEHTAE